MTMLQQYQLHDREGGLYRRKLSELRAKHDEIQNQIEQAMEQLGFLKCYIDMMAQKIESLQAATSPDAQAERLLLQQQLVQAKQNLAEAEQNIADSKNQRQAIAQKLIPRKRLLTQSESTQAHHGLSDDQVSPAARPGATEPFPLCHHYPKLPPGHVVPSYKLPNPLRELRQRS